MSSFPYSSTEFNWNSGRLLSRQCRLRYPRIAMAQIIPPAYQTQRGSALSKIIPARSRTDTGWYRPGDGEDCHIPTAHVFRRKFGSESLADRECDHLTHCDNQNRQDKPDEVAGKTKHTEADHIEGTTECHGCHGGVLLGLRTDPELSENHQDCACTEHIPILGGWNLMHIPQINGESVVHLLVHEEHQHRNTQECNEQVILEHYPVTAYGVKKWLVLRFLQFDRHGFRDDLNDQKWR